MRVLVTYGSKRGFIKRHAQALRRMPVWLFSSGPLDGSASHTELPPVPQVQHAMDWIGARDHRTFGGRLLPDAKGFIASRIAKGRSGDWRDPWLIHDWAVEIAGQLRAERAPSPGALPHAEEPLLHS